jgi:Tetracyclin repressor-like, C-terminal domain
MTWPAASPPSARRSGPGPLAHPHEYALIYGSPVPGYVAPPDTVAPASRVTTRLMWIIIDAPAAGRIFFAECIRRWLDFMNLG